MQICFIFLSITAFSPKKTRLIYQPLLFAFMYALLFNMKKSIRGIPPHPVRDLPMIIKAVF